MKITQKGQVTIPQELRERFGLMPNTEVEFVVEGDSLVVRKVESDGSRGKRLVAHLRGRATVKMSTEEIMALTRGD